MKNTIVNQMIEKKSWDEFRKTGLLLFINSFLNIFGWAIVYNTDENQGYPVRVKFRGFDEKDTAEAYIKLTTYLKENSKILLEETKL